MSLLAEVALSVDASPWDALGLRLDGNRTQVGRVALRFGATLDGLGLTLLDDETRLPDRVDGIATYAHDVPGGEPPAHPLGVTRIDHVVVATPDLVRTVGAFEAALRTPVRRIRTEPTGSGAPFHQAFFRLGEAILEIVGPPSVDPVRASEPARLSGIVFTVADLDAACARLGPERVSPPKPAVQPGKRIATVRREADLGWPVALISG